MPPRSIQQFKAAFLRSSPSTTAEGIEKYLVYTGLTRGKQLVVLVGQQKALAMAVKNHLGRRRHTKLAEWLSSL